MRYSGRSKCRVVTPIHCSFTLKEGSSINFQPWPLDHSWTLTTWPCLWKIETTPQILSKESLVKWMGVTTLQVPYLHCKVCWCPPCTSRSSQVLWKQYHGVNVLRAGIIISYLPSLFLYSCFAFPALSLKKNPHRYFEINKNMAWWKVVWSVIGALGGGN